MHLAVHSFRKVAALLDIPKTTVHRWVNSTPYVQRRLCAKQKKLDFLAYINHSVYKNPFLTLKQLSALTFVNCGLQVSRSSISRYLRALSISRKRTKYVPYVDKVVQKKRSDFAECLPADKPV